MTSKRFWGELKTTEFATLDPHMTIAILPVAATEQHGPHLPVSTDTTLMEGMIKTVLQRLPNDLNVLFLPVQAIGKSNEHLRSPGTVTFTAAQLLDIWYAIGEAVHRAGLRKFMIINSHGGNAEVIAIIARELRVRLNMLVATTQWRRFGLPANTFSAYDATYGIHAGDIETSLMLHFRPDLVDMAKAKNFSSSAPGMENEYVHLRPIGTHAFGWIAPDLNADGAVGDASAATAAKGKATAEHQADGFIALLKDIAQFPLDKLA
jgi:creatinine amidohydrolase